MDCSNPALSFRTDNGVFVLHGHDLTTEAGFGEGDIFARFIEKELEPMGCTVTRQTLLFLAVRKYLLPHLKPAPLHVSYDMDTLYNPVRLCDAGGNALELSAGDMFGLAATVAITPMMLLSLTTTPETQEFVRECGDRDFIVVSYPNGEHARTRV